MDNNQIYFVNSQGKRAVIASAENRNFFEMKGRSGFSAPDVEIFTEQMASGITKYYGKTMKPRTCSIKMICRGKSKAQMDHMLFSMLDILLDTDGTREGKLYVRRSDGVMAYLNCVYTGGMSIINEYRCFQKFTLTFYAADPAFYIDANFTDITIGTPHQPQVTFNNLSGRDSAFYMVCNDLKYARPYLRYWHLNGTITNLDTGKKLTFLLDSAAYDINEQLVFDFRKNNPILYFEDAEGNRKNASWVLDWNQTDLDFCTVPGANTIDFKLGITNAIKNIFGFPYICYGV